VISAAAADDDDVTKPRRNSANQRACNESFGLVHCSDAPASIFKFDTYNYIDIFTLSIECTHDTGRKNHWPEIALSRRFISYNSAVTCNLYYMSDGPLRYVSRSLAQLSVVLQLGTLYQQPFKTYLHHHHISAAISKLKFFCRRKTLIHRNTFVIA